jgi:signal transduction histidine kinase
MLDSLSMLTNGITLALAFGLLLIVLWHNVRKELNQYFAVFLIMVMLWNAGALLTQTALLLNADEVLIRIAVGTMELGFTGASVGVFALTSAIARAQTRSFRALAFLSLIVVLAYRAAVSLSVPETLLNADRLPALNYQGQPLLWIFYLVFDGATLYLVWRHQRKIRARELVTGLGLFVIGQSVAFLNPDLQAFTLSTIVSSLAALIISFGVLKLEIISPLAERMSQVEAIHRVSLAITSQIGLKTVLEQIAVQAAAWLRAEAVGIWLYRDGQLELTAVHHLPNSFVNRRLALGQGVIGTVAQSRQAMHLEDYRRDWRGVPDLPVARETFGSVVAAPLTYGQEVIGALMVIAARDGRLFDRDDVHLLELLGAQAAVAISNSHLFEEQKALADEVEFSRSQLETVLTSTQNPVIAVNRKLDIIFANPAAHAIMGRAYHSLLPLLGRAGPPVIHDSPRTILRRLRQQGDYRGEITVGVTDYLCYVTALRYGHTDGWVAILNDITHLKELDRLKNEMVRMTSHDLKNPLQAAMANLDLLRDDLAASSDPEVTHSLNVIERQLQRMNRIIRGILDLERARTGALKIEAVEPSRLVGETIEEMRHVIDEQKLRFEVEVAPNLSTLHCDPDQFKRALVNLVENAFKFTPAGGSVRLIVNATSDGEVCFTVADSGVGIPDEARPLIFDRFFRVNQAGTEHVTGSGLGLSLVKTIVESHHGRIDVTSAVGQGTTFTVTLPAGKQPKR